MIENVYPFNKTELSAVGQSRKLPRNIRACGRGGGPLPVYVEDYVETYIRRLAGSSTYDYATAVLVGQVMETEIGRCLFIRGAISAGAVCESGKPVFGEAIWNEVYDKIRLYFPTDEVVGWCVAGPGFRMQEEAAFLRAHIDNFADSEKVFLSYESLETDVVMRICKDGSFFTLPGYYIYYEKNDEMQDYMLSHTFSQRGRHEDTSLVYEREERERNRAMEAAEGSSITAVKKEKETGKGTESGNVRQESSRRDILQLAAVACIIVLIISVMVGTDIISTLKESATAGNVAMDDSGEITGNPETTVPTKDPMALAFDDFDFINKDETNDDSSSTAENSVTTSPDAEEDKPGTVGDKIETAEGTGTNSQGEDSNAVTENSGSKTDGEDNENAAPDGETKVADGQTEPSDDKSDTPGGQIETANGNTDLEGKPEDNPNIIDEETVAVIAPSEYTRYEIQKGDTLASICKKVYGSVELLSYISELNQIADINRIFVGQELILPKK